MKAITALTATVICVGLGLIPEAMMYFIWHMVHATQDWARIALVAVFLFGGGGFCFLAAFLAFSLWVFFMAVIFD